MEAADEGAFVYWPSIDATFTGQFQPPVGKALSLDGGNNLIQNTADNPSTPIVWFRGSVEIVTTLTEDAQYGNRTLTMADTSALAAGDIIILEDDKGQGGPGVGTACNQEVLKIRTVDSSTVVTVYDKVRSMQDSGTRNVYKITPVRGVRMRNMKVRRTSSASGNHAIQVYLGEDVKLWNCEGSNTFTHGLSINRVYDFELHDCKGYDGFAIGNGNTNYAISIGICRKGKIVRPEMSNARRGMDLAQCYDIDIYDLYSSRCLSGISICHNMYGGAIRIYNPRILDVRDDAPNFGILQGVQSIPNPQNYVLRDVEIHNARINHLMAPNDGMARGVEIGSSWANLVIDGVECSFGRTESIPTDNDNNAIVWLGGVARGQTIIRNVRTPQGSRGDTLYGASWAVLGNLVGTPTTGGGGQISLVVIEDCFNHWGAGVVKMAGCKHLATKNLTMGVAAGSAIKSLSTAYTVANVTNESIGVHAVVT
jgi:hypothetical protein